MRWYHFVAYFFAGAFLANAIPHLTNGISGRPFPSPFATPPGQGESSSTINVLWGMFNVVVGYVLLRYVGTFDIRKPWHATTVGVGATAMAIGLARGFGQLYGGL